jgi:hypothetical protein
VMMIDSTAVRAHRAASGAKGGARPSHRPLARRTHHQDPCPDRPSGPAARVPPDRRQHRRYHGRSAAAGRGGGQRLADRRQRLRRRSSARAAR